MGFACEAFAGKEGLALTMKRNWRALLTAGWRGAIRWDAPLAEFTTLRVGGPAAAVAFPASSGELAGLVHLLNAQGVDWRVLGRGSNVLASDSGYDGVVIVLDRRFGAMSLETEATEGGLVRAEAGGGLAGLLMWCAGQQLTGLEFLAGIPGSVGGALAMNAGAWGNEIAERVAAVELLDDNGSLRRIERPALRFFYRHLALPARTVIVAGVFALQTGGQPQIEEQMSAYIAQRREKQPKGVANAGSFFKNPPSAAAGRLIEQAGLKGATVGGAMVSPVHANFLVNTGTASARNLFDLMRLVQEKVEKKFGVRLEPEVHLLGEFGRRSQEGKGA